MHHELAYKTLWNNAYFSIRKRIRLKELIEMTDVGETGTIDKFEDEGWA